MAAKMMKTAMLVAGAALLMPAAGGAQSSIGPVSSDPVTLHHQLQYRIMAETARELAAMTERMSHGPLNAEERKSMANQMARISHRMRVMSGLEGRPAHNHAGLQKQMDQMRSQLREMERAMATGTPTAR